MLKKFVSLIFAVLLSVTVIGGTVWAQNISTYDISGHTKASMLSIIGKTATCTSTYLSTKDDCKTITVVQTLEKHSFLIFWSTIGNECTKTVYDTSDLSFINYKYNLESGTYRVKSVFTVELNDGETETVTVYSGEQSI